MRWISLILIIQFISGCGINKIPEHAGQHFPYVEESLWKLTIEQWGTERFTGLLAVRTIGPDFHLVLLDATGIKLLETTISNGSDVSVVFALKAVRDRGLPEYLTRSTSRIFETRRPALVLFWFGLWTIFIVKTHLKDLLVRCCESHGSALS